MKLNTGTVHHIKSNSYGIMAQVNTLWDNVKLKTTYAVRIYDDEAREWLPTTRFFKTESEALAYARRCV